MWALGWLAQEATQNEAWSLFAQYGVVGALAFGGLVFAWRVYRVSDAERIALAERNRELNARMLVMASEHKDEILKIYQTVMPTMADTVSALKEASRLIEQHRRDRDRARNE